MANGQGAQDSRFVQRIQPKLRMICNGDDDVNNLRAETSGVVQASPDMVATKEQVRAIKAPKVFREALELDEREERDEPDAPLSQDVRVSVFVELEQEPEGELADLIQGASARQGKLLTAEMSPADIDRLAQRPGVSYVGVGDALNAPTPRLEPVRPGKPKKRVSGPELEPSGGAGVLIGLIDVGGFDFAHEDFVYKEGDKTRTRFAAIWDQGADGSGPPGFDYGAEYTREQLNHAIELGEEFHVGPTDLLPQSVQVAGSHGTHVASIAAGNLGLAPKAVLAGVLIELTDDERERRRSFYDSTRLVHAVEYLFALAARLGTSEQPLPVVINISLGTNGHAHDGSSPASRWIDGSLGVRGRCVCVAAGNAGQEAPLFEGDLGYLMGRIHTSGRIAASGLETDIEWQVVGNGVVDGSENELNIWYEAQDRFDVRVKPPEGDWIEPVSVGEYIENRRLPSGTFISVYNERYHPANGSNRISVFLSPYLKDPVIGVQAGTWTVRLRGEDVRDGRFDAWIERDDPRPAGRRGEDPSLWHFPSYFTRRSNVDRSSVSSLACGHRILSVANYEEEAERINASSSQGPTRDGRFKPEVAAPGTRIVAARGFSGPSDAWVSLTGTSMAAPHVTGVAARMLAVEPRLTAAQIVGIMRRTAQPLPGADYHWKEDAGFGRIQAAACVAEAAVAFRERDLDDEADDLDDEADDPGDKPDRADP